MTQNELRRADTPKTWRLCKAADCQRDKKENECVYTATMPPTSTGKVKKKSEKGWLRSQTIRLGVRRPELSSESYKKFLVHKLQSFFDSDVFSLQKK